MLRCKPGQMAEIIEDEFPHNVGAIVTVLAPCRPEDIAGHYGDAAIRVCKPVMPIMTLCVVTGKPYLEFNEIVAKDAWLKPILPPPETVDQEVEATA